MSQGATGHTDEAAHRVDIGRGRDSHDDFEEATFVASAEPPRAATSPSAFPLRPTTAPLHAPLFPLSPDGGSTAIDLHSPGRPLRGLPTALYFTEDARAGASNGSNGANSGSNAADGDGVEKQAPTSAAMAEAAAAAAVGAATPPAEDAERWYQEQIDYVRNQVEQMESMDTRRGQEAKSIRSKWKRELFLLFEDPSSSPSAFVINIFVTFMIIFSAVLTTIETIPSLRKGNTQMWLAMELAIVAVFTLEFVLRFLGHTDSWRQAWAHIRSFVTIIDALAIFPFYIELLFHRDTSYEFRFTILRIFRLLRVFSAFKYSSLLQLSIEVMIVAIKRSSDALLAFLLFVTLTVLLFSTLMYFAERGTWDEERQAFLTSDGEYSKFSSIPAAAYYAIVTLTTTGFGDMVPTTFIGKLVSFPMMIAGILLIALPSIIVGRNFTQVWEAARKYRVQRSTARQQRMGGTLVDDDDDDDGYGNGGGRDGGRRMNNAGGDAAHVVTGSGRTSRRSRRLRYRGGNARVRRDDSVSSFESLSPRMSTRSPMETKPGGYTTLYNGQDNTASTSYEHGVRDPIDALARKDSFEMQEIASRRSSDDDRPDGYRQVAADGGDTHDDIMVATAAAGWDRRRRGSMSESAGSQYSRATGSVRRRTGGSRLSRRKAPAGAGADRGGKGKERDEGAGDMPLVKTLSIGEWQSMNHELAALRLSVARNDEVLRAIAQHLSVDVPPSSGTATGQNTATAATP